EALARFSEASAKPIISCFLGDASMRSQRHRLDSVGLPAFRTPESAANAFGIMASYQYNQTMAQQTLPPEMLSRPPRLDEARALLNDAIMSGRSELDQSSCRWLLDCFHVPIRLDEQPVPDDARERVPLEIGRASCRGSGQPRGGGVRR